MFANLFFFFLGIFVSIKFHSFVTDAYSRLRESEYFRLLVDKWNRYWNHPKRTGKPCIVLRSDGRYVISRYENYRRLTLELEPDGGHDWWYSVPERHTTFDTLEDAEEVLATFKKAGDPSKDKLIY